MSSDGDDKQTKQKNSHHNERRKRERKEQSQPLFTFSHSFHSLFFYLSRSLPFRFPRNNQKKTYVGDGAGLPDDAFDLFELSQSLASVSGALFNSTIDKRTA